MLKITIPKKKFFYKDTLTTAGNAISPNGGIYMPMDTYRSVAGKI